MLAALERLWGRHGVPRRIQFDNGGPFTAPTGVGEVVRVCLHQGATPVFVPPREPWRNGTIEHFNDTFDRRFFRHERFGDLDQLADRASAFERFHNAQHRYRATGRRTPDQTTRPHRAAPLTADQIPAGWPEHGRIEFIRFIRSDHKLRLLGRAIAMPDGAAYQYVTATLDLALPTERNLLISDTDGELIATARLQPPRPR